MNSGGFLKKQLEEQKFVRGAAYVQASAHGLKRMTTSELAYLNRMLTGNEDEQWRLEATSVTIPSGQTHQFNILSNPMHSARDILGNAQQLAGNQDYLEAAFFLYSHLILQHLFIDANRRTAALAVFWVLLAHDQTIDVRKLAALEVGDLREEAPRTKLKSQIQQMMSDG